MYSWDSAESTGPDGMKLVGVSDNVFVIACNY